MGLASVVIPAHNAARTIAEQLQALVDQHDPPPFEVVVVANRCTDATAAVAAEFAGRLELSVVVADERGSAAYARNVGAAAAVGDVLLFCDADDWVGPGWVGGLAGVLRAGAGYAGGPILIDRTGLPNWAYEMFYARIDRLYLRGGDDDYRPPAGSLGVTREAFEHVGGFDETLATSEDSDITQRLMDAGYTMAICLTAELWHRPKTTVGGELKRIRWYAYGSAQLLAKEGRLREPSGWWLEAWRSAKWTLNLVFRQRVWRPAAIFLHVASRRINERARRREWAKQFTNSEVAG